MIINLFGQVRKQCAFHYAKFCKPPLQSGIAWFMIFQLQLVSEARILTLAYVCTYLVEIKQLSNWAVSVCIHCCFVLNWDPSCISQQFNNWAWYYFVTNELVILIDNTIVISNKSCFWWMMCNNHRFDNAHVSMISYSNHVHHLLKLHCTTVGKLIDWITCYIVKGQQHTLCYYTGFCFIGKHW